MPTYTFKNLKTGEVKDEIMSISDIEKLTSEGEWKQVIGAPQLVTHVGSVVTKTSQGWQDHLKKIKKSSGSGNTIKT